MGEISGFGGGYEQCCRDMLAAGVAWLDANKDAVPEFHGFKNVYGVVMEDNEAAKALTKAVIDAAKGEATGAMHHAAISHLMVIRSKGWEYYVDELRKREREEAES
jgi:hypothetical protein